jgi:glycosyltransferase involved in cell wall biosynthesis
MRICQIIDQLKGGGQERIAVEFANQLAGREVESYLFATRRGGDYSKQVLPTVGLRIMTRRSRWDLAPWWDAFRWLRERDFDLIHAHSPGSLFWAGVGKLLFGLKYRMVYHLQMLPPPGLWRTVALAIIRLFRSQISLAFVMNDVLRDRLVSRFGFSDTKVEILMNPTNFPPDPPERVAPLVPHLVMVAQWRPQKDHRTVIRAAALLKERGFAARWSFLGAEEDEALVQSAREEIGRRGVANCVEICGRRTDVRAELLTATAGVLSTHFEGQPVSVIEYCAAALPAIVSVVEGTSQLVSPENGIIGVPPGDAAALADAVTLVIMSEDKGRSLGISAFRYMKDRADADLVFVRVIQGYRKAMLE